MSYSALNNYFGYSTTKLITKPLTIFAKDLPAQISRKIEKDTWLLARYDLTFSYQS
jgi:hypothetical protein